MIHKTSKKKKLNNFIVAMFITVAITGLAFAPISAAGQSNPYTDVQQGAYYEAITTLSNQQIISGVTTTQFKPNVEITREDAALFLAKALQLDTTNVTDPGFKDVPKTSKYYGAIAALSQKQIIAGYDSSTFKPKNTLTRAQASKILSLGFGLNVATSSKTKFTDVNKLTDSNIKRYIQTLVNYKITTGTTSTTFSPNAKLTRGQLATLLYRTINLNNVNNDNVNNNEFNILNVE